MEYRFFVSLECSHDVLSMIFGIFGKLQIDIEKDPDPKKNHLENSFEKKKSENLRKFSMFFEICHIGLSMIFLS